MPTEIIGFSVQSLFDEFDHEIDFEKSIVNVNQARILIMIGRNGIGKTTILNMIEGMLTLDFDIFRKVPFSNGALKLSGGSTLTIENLKDENIFLVKFNGHEARLSAIKTGTDIPQDIPAIESFRAAALPVLKQVSFEKLDIHRSIALRGKEAGQHLVDGISDDGKRVILKKEISGKLIKHIPEKSNLSQKVKRFVSEAQVDYKKYFFSEVPELFPRILKRLKIGNSSTTTITELIDRLEKIRSSEEEMARFGLTMNISDIDQLSALLKQEEPDTQDNAVIAALEVYVETLESKHEERELIATRLKKFESLVNKFFEGKSFHIDYEEGFKIKTSNGKEISEVQLSSGEYHLLYMMITALVSTRRGTAIAIDEPELSLHISWQRQLVNALVECASGASPLLIFATHSTPIASEYQDSWVDLNIATEKHQ